MVKNRILKSYFLPVPLPQGSVQGNVRAFHFLGKCQVLLEHRNTLNSGRNFSEGIHHMSAKNSGSNVSHVPLGSRRHPLFDSAPQEVSLGEGTARLRVWPRFGSL